MSELSVKNYNPNNVNGTLYTYQSNKTAPTNPIQQAPGTNYASSVSLETPPDSFESVNGVKTLNNKNKEKGLSTGLKWLLGIAGTAATIYGGVVAHRAFTKPSIEKVAKNFSEIFRRDVSQEEAKKLTENYKRIFQIKDTDEFVDKMFKQVKKDFGYENIDIKWRKLTEKEVSEGLCGGYRPTGIGIGGKEKGNLTNIDFNNIAIEIALNGNKQSLFNTIVHEFNHMKQHEIAYRANKEEFFKAVANSRIPQRANCDALRTDYIDAIKKLYEKEWSKLPQIKVGTSDYDLAMKYIEDLRNYKSSTLSVNFDDYYTQFIEKESRKVGGQTKNIYEYFANIWRLF